MTRSVNESVRGTETVPLTLPGNNGNTSSTQPEPTLMENAATRNPLTLPQERRIVTIMFADIIGSTHLSAQLDPEDMRAILVGYFNLMTEQIRRHGGTVEKYIGDAVMAVFGIPVAHEDDPDRTIRAALDMQTALANFNAKRQSQDPQAIRLQMRIGINSGEVAGPSASFNRQDFLITGDAVNVAARLQQVAAADSILVGERTYLATRDVFDFRALPPVHIKGKAEPVHAWVVEGFRNNDHAITQHPRGIKGLQAPFINRILELTLMHATYARVLAEQHPHLITVLGTPGIGKSRLVREFIEREQEAVKSASTKSRPLAPRVLYGRCPPYGEGLTFWPMVEIIRSLLNVQGGEATPELKKRLLAYVHDVLAKAKSSEEADQVANAIFRSIGSNLAGPPNEPNYGGRRELQLSTRSKKREQGGEQGELMRAWRVFLEAVALLQPLLIVIDDLQWANEALLDLLEYLTDRITDVPILLLGPARPDFFERRRDWGGGRPNFTTIALEALSKEESSELVTALLDTHDLPEVLRYTILSRGEGNPFFMEEIVRMLIDQGVLIYKNGSWHVGTQNEAVLSDLASPAAPPDNTLIDEHYVLPLPRVPDTIQGVLAARIDLLSQVEKQVLQHASIIGRTFWLSALLELAPGLDTTTVYSTINSLIQREFIVEAENVGTRSPIGNDIVFSFKHILIRDVVYNTIPRLRRSQEHAQFALWLEEQAHGNIEAFVELLAYHYRQAYITWSPGLLPASLPPQEASSADLEPLNMPIQLTRSQLRERAISYLTMAGDQALYSYYTIRAIGAYSEALDLLIDSEADGLTLANMHEKLGDAYAQRANADEAWKEYRQAYQLVKNAPDVDRHVLIPLYNRLAELGARWLEWFLHEPDMQEVQSYIDKGLKLLEGVEDKSDLAAFLTYQALWYLRQMEKGTPDTRGSLARAAIHSGQEALRIAEELDDTYSLWLTLDAMGFIYDKQRKYKEAYQVQHRRLELASLISSREELHDLYISLGRVHVQIGDYLNAAKWFGRSTRIAETMESPSMLLSSMIGRLHAWYQWNRWKDAREVAQNIIQIVDRYQQDEQWQFEALETLAQIAYRTGEQEEGDAYTRQFKRLVEQPISSVLQADTVVHMGSIYLARQDWPRAKADFKEALHHREPFPSPAVLANLAEAQVLTGESREVQQSTCERAVSYAEQSGARKSLAIALRARGRMHLDQQDWEAAQEDLEQALTQCQMLDTPWEQGQTLYCLGILYLRRAELQNRESEDSREADLSRSRKYLEQALGFFESLKAVHDAERTRLVLHQNNKAPV